MFAEPRLKDKNNTFVVKLLNEKSIKLLKVAAIYGPNATGKSNLLKAMRVVSKLLKQPADIGKKLPVQPFAFDPALLDQPSKFETNFITEGKRYQYTIHLTQDRIHFESLSVFARDKELKLFVREYHSDSYQYTFGESLEGREDLHKLWSDTTAKNRSFLSSAISNSSEDFTQLLKPFTWLKDGSQFIFGDLEPFASASTSICAESSDDAEVVAEFLSDFDIPIRSISVTPKSKTEGLEASLAQYENKKNKHTISHLSDFEIKLTHRSRLGDASIDYVDQSDGTKNLFAFWLPWVVRDSSAAPWRALIVDEIDASLHPGVVVELVARHLRGDKATQLIFTTHDTHLMDSRLLRRDQLWITERNIDGATELRSIHDFEGREGEDIEKRYHEGRYRGLPIIRRSK